MRGNADISCGAPFWAVEACRASVGRMDEWRRSLFCYEEISCCNSGSSRSIAAWGTSIARLRPAHLNVARLSRKGLFNIAQPIELQKDLRQVERLKGFWLNLFEAEGAIWRGVLTQRIICASPFQCSLSEWMT
jgi:hypothetical protein